MRYFPARPSRPGALRWARGLLAAALVTAGGCASLGSAGMAERLSQAMLNQSDPEVVRSGAPAYLLLLDSLIADDPRDVTLLLAGARLYGAYAGGLVTDPGRQRTLTASALEYARRALCAASPGVCAALPQPYPAFVLALEPVRDANLAVLYGYATAWVGFIQARPGDWAAIAELPKAQEILGRVAAYRPDYDRGRAQLYLAALLALRPAALGGRPEQAREHFELALRYSAGRDLLAKVEYARRYARLVYDQTLHDRLLQEVLAAEPVEPGLTLSNVLARETAGKLLADGYF
jgi:hypothetical protein